MTGAWDQLARFIAQDARLPVAGSHGLTRETDLYHDLDMNPDHVARLIDEWAARFNVDVSDFDLHHYYPSANLPRGSFLATVLRSPFNAQARNTLGGRSLTLGMLEKAMQNGRWDP